MAEKKSTRIRRISDASVKAKTGKDWKKWFSILDRWDMKENGPTVTVRHLQATYGLNAWWAEAIIFRYEREARA